MDIIINRILAPVTVLGAGRRVVVWVQGCDLACPGCASVDTWDMSLGTRRSADAVAEALAAEIRARDLDGLTITGGEPMDQAPALAEMITRLREILASWHRADGFDILAFSGYTTAAARRRAGSLWQLLDIAVCGPYRRDLPSDVALVATRNQEVNPLTPRGVSKYALLTSPTRMQVMSDGESLVMVGLPRPGELDKFTQMMAERGIELAGASWRS